MNKNVDRIINVLNQIEYGWVDKNGNIYNEVNDLFSDNYVLESPDEVLKNKVGVCFDQVELERKLFADENINFSTYFIVHYNDDNLPSHTFLIYKDNNKYYWFENSWIRYKGIHEYSSVNDALIDIKEKFVESEIDTDYNPYNLCIYKYNKPKYGISSLQFYNHCESGENIKL